MAHGTLNSVLGEATAAQAEELTADDFAAFCRDKVEDVRSFTATTPLYDLPHRSTPTIDGWNSVTVDDIEKLIALHCVRLVSLIRLQLGLSRTCVNYCHHSLLCCSTSHCQLACFLAAFKLAVIRPLLKKSRLDPSQMKNCRHVSNLSFLSKLLQRVVQVHTVSTTALRRLSNQIKSNQIKFICFSIARLHSSDD